MRSVPRHVSKLAKKRLPKVISLDAFGTLYVPGESPFEIYHRFGIKFGINKPTDSIRKDFISSFSQLKKKYPNYGINTDLLSEYNEFKQPIEDEKSVEFTGAYPLRYSDNWWGLLMKKSFEPFEVPVEMARELIEFFSGKAYIADSDLLAVLKKLKAFDLSEHEEPDDDHSIKTKNNKVIALINSNGDPRVKVILQHLNLINEDLIPESLIFFSYNTQIEKPDKESFENILQGLIKQGYLTGCDLHNESDKQRLLKYCWHFGDKYETDLQGAMNSGWNGILIDRSHDFDYFLNKKDLGFRKVEVEGLTFLHDGGKRYIIKDYKQLNLIFFGGFPKN